MELYKVTLSEQEREELKAITSRGVHPSQKVLNALILLNCDQSEAASEVYRGVDIAGVLGVSHRKIDRLKKRFVEDGFEAALTKQAPQRDYVSKVDGEVEARLIALSCGHPPEGQARWSLRLLADQAVELNYVPELSHETVRQVLKKTNSSPGKNRLGDRTTGQRRVRCGDGKCAGCLL